MTTTGGNTGRNGTAEIVQEKEATFEFGFQMIVLVQCLASNRHHHSPPDSTEAILSSMKHACGKYLQRIRKGGRSKEHMRSKMLQLMFLIPILFHDSAHGCAFDWKHYGKHLARVQAEPLGVEFYDTTRPLTLFLLLEILCRHMRPSFRFLDRAGKFYDVRKLHRRFHVSKKQRTREDGGEEEGKEGAGGGGGTPFLLPTQLNSEYISSLVHWTTQLHGDVQRQADQMDHGLDQIREAGIRSDRHTYDGPTRVWFEFALKRVFEWSEPGKSLWRSDWFFPLSVACLRGLLSDDLFFPSSSSSSTANASLFSSSSSSYGDSSLDFVVTTQTRQLMDAAKLRDDVSKFSFDFFTRIAQQCHRETFQWGGDDWPKDNKSTDPATSIAKSSRRPASTTNTTNTNAAELEAWFLDDIHQTLHEFPPSLPSPLPDPQLDRTHSISSFLNSSDDPPFVLEPSAVKVVGGGGNEKKKRSKETSIYTPVPLSPFLFTSIFTNDLTFPSSPTKSPILTSVLNRNKHRPHPPDDTYDWVWTGPKLMQNLCFHMESEFCEYQHLGQRLDGLLEWSNNQEEGGVRSGLFADHWIRYLKFEQSHDYPLVVYQHQALKVPMIKMRCTNQGRQVIDAHLLSPHSSSREQLQSWRLKQSLFRFFTTSRGRNRCGHQIHLPLVELAETPGYIQWNSVSSAPDSDWGDEDGSDQDDRRMYVKENAIQNQGVVFVEVLDYRYEWQPISISDLKSSPHWSDEDRILIYSLWMFMACVYGPIADPPPILFARDSTRYPALRLKWSWSEQHGLPAYVPASVDTPPSLLPRVKHQVSRWFKQWFVYSVCMKHESMDLGQYNQLQSSLYVLF